MTPPLIVLPDRNGEMARLVRALRDVESGELPEHAVVGGLAVMARLEQAHRVTTDIDEALRGADRAEVAALIVARGTGARHSPNGVVLADQTAVDLIAIGAFAEGDLPDELPDRVFVLAHDYAIRTAQPVTLQARRGSAVLAQVTVPVATAAALVACKTSASFGRRGATASSKRAIDVLDLFRLLTGHDVAAALRAAPYGLGSSVAELLERLLVDGADRYARDLRGLGVNAAGISAEALALVGTRVVAAVREGP